MGFLDFFKKSDVNSGVQEFHSEKHAILIDVREPGEFKQGHIPGAQNIPLSKIENTLSVIHERETPVYVYCQSGARSSRAAYALKEMGYTKVKNIGGIQGYYGQLEK